MQSSSTYKRTVWLMISVIFLLGMGLRFYQLGVLPQGLYQDEAYNGLDGLDWQAGKLQALWFGKLPVYFTANNGREPLHLIAVSASIATFGNSIWALRLPSAVIGLLGILAALALGWGYANRRVGIWCAGCYAFSFWGLAIARISLRAGWFPVLFAACAASLLWADRLKKPGLWWLGGALLGLSFYTYSAAQLTLPLLGIGLAWLYLRNMFSYKKSLLMFAGAGLVCIPLGWAILHAPEVLFNRSGQVSIFSEQINHGDLPGALWRNVLATLGMFNLAGDRISRHNLPYRPVFDPLAGLYFLLGVGVTLWKAFRPNIPARVQALAGLGMLALLAYLPGTLFAEDAPHFLRGIGVLMPAILLCASGLETASQWAGRKFAPLRWGLPILVLISSALLTTHDYFGRYARASETDIFFQRVPTELAQSALASPAQNLLMDRRLWDGFASVRYLLARESRLQLFDNTPNPQACGTSCWLYAYQDSATAPLVHSLPQNSVLGLRASAPYRGDLPGDAYPLYWTFTSEALPHLPVIARFGDVLELRQAHLAWQKDRLQVQLIFLPLKLSAPPYKIFLHITKPSNELLTQADFFPLANRYLIADWRAGEWLQETLEFSNIPPTANFWLGIYHADSGKRELVYDSDGNQVGDALQILRDDK